MFLRGFLWPGVQEAGNWAPGSALFCVPLSGGGQGDGVTWVNVRCHWAPIFSAAVRAPSMLVRPACPGGDMPPYSWRGLAVRCLYAHVVSALSVRAAGCVMGIGCCVLTGRFGPRWGLRRGCGRKDVALGEILLHVDSQRTSWPLVPLACCIDHSP